ncbi:MAG: c-type cytochrome [Actinobacteria bacterium]|nr:c-type cytochrome [Actinomycetota bacterium]MBA3561131.1 c-type cytochrome [Actinomycetota bacterium]MBA3565709.1 c-type cytochrome [Actinomycetota bacterium]MDQ3085584.1 c-type cytochrome [Actinomycetota bacterium]
MAKGLGEQNREWYARYKDDVKKEGKAFFPRAMLHDTIMGIVVVGVIIGLAVIWFYDADGTEAGVLGPWYEDPAEPGTTDFIPRPDWYFYFLFYLLRIFEWPETVVIATVGIPTILLMLLIGLPFYDRRRERRPSRRPVAMVAAVLTVLSMGVLTYKGATAEETLGSTLIADGVPNEWAEKQGFVGNQKAEAGAELFAATGCLQCHIYLGLGAGNLGAPDLSEIGQTNDVAYFVQYLSNPARFGNTVMGSYSYLGQENLAALGAFLEASKGGEEPDSR